MLPPFFLSPRASRRLNVAAVGLSLAAVTSAVLGSAGGGAGFGQAAFVGGPTLFVGSLWVWRLQKQAAVGLRRMYCDWRLVALLPALNAGPLLLLTALGGDRLVLSQGIVFVIFGLLASLPIFAFALAIFGPPLAWAEKQARRGLAGEEQGEGVLGLTSAAVCLVTLIGVAHRCLGEAQGELPAPGASLPFTGESLLALAWVVGLGLLGLGAGALAAGLAVRQERQRRRFVAEAEAGKVPGYRVDTSEDGRVLVRVASRDQAYRGADHEVELCALDEVDEPLPDLRGRRSCPD